MWIPVELWRHMNRIAQFQDTQVWLRLLGGDIVYSKTIPLKRLSRSVHTCIKSSQASASENNDEPDRPPSRNFLHALIMNTCMWYSGSGFLPYLPLALLLASVTFRIVSAKRWDIFSHFHCVLSFELGDSGQRIAFDGHFTHAYIGIHHFWMQYGLLLIYWVLIME